MLGFYKVFVYCQLEWMKTWWIALYMLIIIIAYKIIALQKKNYCTTNYDSRKLSIVLNTLHNF